MTIRLNRYYKLKTNNTYCSQQQQLSHYAQNGIRQQYGEILMTSMGIVLRRINIENIRSIKKSDIEINDNTVLFGHNNSGKSNLLYAINLVFGKSRLEKEDIFFSSDCPYSKNKEAKVDLLFLPTDNNSAVCKEFNEQWMEILGTLIGYDAVDGSQFFGVSAIFSYDYDMNGYRRARKRILQWSDTIQSSGEYIPEKVMDHFDCIYIDAQRDISLDISDRHSFWNNRISRMDMPSELKEEYGNTIKQLNDSIISNNPVLIDVRENLNKIIPEGEITINLIPEDLSKLHRGLEISITENETTIPISNMGLGTRSQAVFSSIKTITNANIDDPELMMYCIILAEEPESHLHPSLQKTLAKEFECMKAQRIITTHSPFFISESNIQNLVCCGHEKEGSTYSCLKDHGLPSEKIEPLKRVFIERKADALFSDIIILAEGETESCVIPIFLEKHFNKTPDQMNIVIVNVGGYTNYKPFLIACRVFKIKWVVFSDGEKKVIDELKKSTDHIFGNDSFNTYLNKNIFILPNEKCYEDYLIEEGYSNTIESTLLRDDRFKDQFTKQMDNARKQCPESTESKLLSNVIKIKKNKTEYAKPIAKAICENDTMPKIILQLLDTIEKLQGEIT